MSIEDHETDRPTDSDQSSEERRDAARTLEQLLVCAKAYERAAGSSTDSEEWFRAESESLLHWAQDTGRLLSRAEFGNLIDGFEMLEGGLEHQVFFQKGLVVKKTKPPHFGHMWDLRGYVQNLIWCNEVFEDDIRLKGVLQTEEGMSLVITQPYIDGRKPTEAELVEWFTLQGCRRLSTLRWEYPNGMIIADAHAGNLILMQDGTLVPVDLHVERLGNS